MRKLITGLFVVLATGLFAQTRPNNFTELPTVDNTNFEVYSQKNGLPRRASLETLKRYFDQALTFANDTLSLSGVDGGQKIYLPTGVSAINDLSDGYTEGTGNVFLGTLPQSNYAGQKVVSVGIDAGKSMLNPSSYNAGMQILGYKAYQNVAKPCDGCTIIGTLAAGYTTTAPEGLIAIGELAGASTANSGNLFIGNGAGQLNTSGVSNMYAGHGAGKRFFGNYNLIIGNHYDPIDTFNVNNYISIGSYDNVDRLENVSSNLAVFGNTKTTKTQFYGNIDLDGYGLSNKEASDLGKTGSGYFLEVATDGTLVETSISGAISNTFQQVVSSNSFDTIHVVAKPGAVSLATSNSRANYDLSVSSLADVRTVSIVMDLTVGTRQTQTIIKVDDASNESNVSLGTLMLPSITVYDAAPTLLDVNEVYNVTETLTNGDLPYKITFNNDGTYNIVFGQGDWGSKSRVVVTINF